MTIRRKTLTIVGVTLVGLIVVLYATSRIILGGSFAKLEQDHVRQNYEGAPGQPYAIHQFRWPDCLQ